MKVLPHGASCRVRRRYRRALPQHFCARAWWSLCGSWHRRGRRGGKPTEKMQREKTHQPSTASTSSISDPSELIPALLRFSSPLASLISLSFYLLSLVQQITQPPLLPLLPFSFCSTAFPLPLACQFCMDISAALGHLMWCQRRHQSRAPDLQQV